MKVLIVQNGWSGQGISGGDKHLIDAAGVWQKNHSITLLLPQSGRIFLERNFTQEVGAFKMKRTWELIPLGQLSNLFALLVAYSQRTLTSCVQLFFLSRLYDVGISSSHFLYDLLPVVFLRTFGKARAVVYVYHLLGDQGRKSNLRSRLALLGEAISLWLIKNCFDLVITDNRQVQNRLGRSGIAQAKIKVVPMGIRRPVFLEGLSKEFDLCFLGRLTSQKGVFDLIEVLERIVRRLAQTRLVVMGSGDAEKKLRQLVEEKNLESKVVFLGAVDEETKYRTLQRSRVFVSPSYEEGWGLSLSEALSLGLPAVVYDLPALREVFNDGPIYVPTGDVVALAEEIQALLNSSTFYSLKSRDALESVKNYYREDVFLSEHQLIDSLTG